MTIPELLKTSRTIAVVGLSSKRFRPSYGVSEYRQHNGYRIIPVNPLEQKRCSVKDVIPILIAFCERVDIVDIFRRPESVPKMVDAAIRIGARAVWMQEGVVHEEAAKKEPAMPASWW